MTFEEQLTEGEKFQDYVSDLLYDSGIPINQYVSREYQYEKGESRAGVEIKYDKKMADTGNIYIELAERHSKDKKYIKSGILRKDNTKFYVIGNYKRVFMFSKKQLVSIAKKFKRVQNDTSIGVLIPLKYIEEHDTLALIEWRDGKIYEKENEQTIEPGKE